MGKIEGKVAVITGSASGMGRATALLFAREGAKVVVADWDAGGQAVADQIAAEGGAAIFVKIDVSKPEDVEALVNKAVATFGRLDIMYNNAGIEDELKPTAECTLENWHRVLSINLSGVFYGMKFAIAQMLRQGGGGVVINTASAAALVGIPYQPAYTASKGGVLQLTKAAALEYARDGIRVNAICPGGVATGLTARMGQSMTPEIAQIMARNTPPMARIGQPEEIAAMALFLASDDSSFCTGAPFIVDGGMVAQ